MGKSAVFGSKRHGYNAMQKKRKRRQSVLKNAGRVMGWFFRCGIFIVASLTGFVYGLQQGELNLSEFNPLQGNILKNVEVSGNQMLTKEDLINLASLDSGMYMDSLVEETLVESLKEDPWVASAQVEKKFPSKILITIQEAIPLMSSYENGRWWVYSEKGKVLPLSMNTAYHLPVILAKTEEERLICSNFLKTLYDTDKRLYNDVSQIAYVKEENGIEVFFRNVSFKTLFGSDSVIQREIFTEYRYMVDNYGKELQETNLLDMRFPGFAYIKKVEKRRKNG